MSDSDPRRAAETEGQLSPVSGAASALGPYLRAFDTHRWLVIAIVLGAVLASAAWLSLRDPQYHAQVQILVTPVPDSEGALVGLAIVRAGLAEPARAVETAASLIDTQAAAEETARRLGDERTADSVATAVEVEAGTDSNVVEIGATAGDPETAATLANEFADAALRHRAEVLGPQVERRIQEVRSELASLPPEGAAAAALEEHLAILQTIEDGRDPTLAIAEPAAVPVQAQGAGMLVVLPLAALAGLVLAGVTAVLIELLTRHPLRSEAEILAVYPLGILARVPVRTRGAGAAARNELPSEAGEGYRALRTRLALADAPTHRVTEIAGLRGSVAFVSPNRGDGRTSSALGLADAIVKAGGSALVIDLDLRSPGVMRALGLQPGRDLGDFVAGARLADVAVEVPGARGLSVVAAPAAGSQLADRIGGMIEELVVEALGLADCVILDTSAAEESSGALEVVAHTEHLVVVARAQNSTSSGLASLREGLANAAASPRGYLLVL